ncbi:MAG TPA: hypothetical protein VKB14_15495 [Actinomycetales bacterium]|nr:hypothetical protein [Actinomycetales bacterium]
MSVGADAGSAGRNGHSAQDSVRLTGRAALQDLATFVGRAGRVDSAGAARLVAHGDVAAVFVSPVHGGGGPTVLGLRVLRLADPVEIDTTVPLAALSDRFARIVSGGLVGPDAPVRLSLPPQEVAEPWAGMTPPRSGWEVVGTVPEPVLRSAARAGVEEIAAGAGEGAGAHAVTRLRAMVWGRDVDGVPGLPAGAAFTAEALGFLAPHEPVALHRTGAWRRLTTQHGHVLSRTALI